MSIRDFQRLLLASKYSVSHCGLELFLFGLTANLLKLFYVPLVLDQYLVKTRLHDLNENGMHLFHYCCELDCHL